MSFSDEFRKADPLTSAIFGRMGLNGSGPQRNTAGPRWNMVSPGRYEMEGGVPANMQADGNYRSQGAALFPPSGGNLFPGLTGGGGQMQQQPQMQTGGGMAPMGGFNGMTGGPGQVQGFPGMTGGGMQRQSSFAPFGGDEADPYGGGFRGNFGMGVFR